MDNRCPFCFGSNKQHIQYIKMISSLVRKVLGIAKAHLSLGTI